ncbi:hypothetical protein EGK75_11330 [Neisseria weixii]|uniref:EamA domain-containing protein n=1 Tax=Neisseria weixii TaxID=1853276 RepID=A0A3N4MMF9_9NEIS|nr:EamA family transporter [Neisseria weixii]RPD84275.1 hypothetical protein EGK74_11105 [Neisseria weixii]RPD84807.1 hypothetical protein EGK75_11330 [Neisseria weixii]
MNTKDALLMAAVVGIWGINFFFMKTALVDVPPMVLGLLRFLLVIFPAVFFIKPPKIAWYWLALYGIAISFGQFGLMFTALQLGMPTGLAALLVQLQVFLTVLVAGVMMGEPVLRHHLLGMFAAAVGLVLIGIGQYQGNMPLVALLAVVGAAASWAVGNIVVKYIGQVNPLSLVVWGSWSALVAFTAVSLMMYGADGLVSYTLSLSGWGIASILFLAYVSSLVGYTAWGDLLSRHPAGKITPFALCVPVIALLVGYIFLGERLGAWHWAGIVVVMAGLLIHVFGSKWLGRLNK